jgi:hypothetical protein
MIRVECARSGRKAEQIFLALFIFFVPFESFVVPTRFFIAFGECICSDWKGPVS